MKGDAGGILIIVRGQQTAFLLGSDPRLNVSSLFSASIAQLLVGWLRIQGLHPKSRDVSA